MIDHHVPDELLLSYTASTLTSAMSLLVATHVTLCAQCQRRVRLGNAIGGALLQEEIANTDVEELLQKTIARLDDNTTESSTTEIEPHPVLPRPICHALGGGDVPWKFLSPRIRYANLPVSTEYCPVRLFKIAPNVRIPVHGHLGDEFAVVLSGSIIDDGKTTYRRGDILVGTPNDVHRLKTENSETCISLVVLTGGLRPKTIAGYWARHIARI